MEVFDSTVADSLKKGDIAVIPTDTVYGIVAQAFDRSAVERLYELRRKTPQKPFIILIDHIERLQEFEIVLTPAQETFLMNVWPGKVSVILSCASKSFSYLHLGTQTLAFRFPDSKPLLDLISKTGPLVAPSANPEGEKLAQTIEDARRYFGDKVSIYVDAGEPYTGKPSTLVSLLNDAPFVLRQGTVVLE